MTFKHIFLGIINVIEEESPPPPPKVIDKDPYNMSNDEFYTPKTHESQIKVTSGEVLQHATPVVELRAPFVPTYIGEAKLRLFHRLVMFLFYFLKIEIFKGQLISKCLFGVFNSPRK